VLPTPFNKREIITNYDEVCEIAKEVQQEIAR
jgi:hypothetical protein